MLRPLPLPESLRQLSDGDDSVVAIHPFGQVALDASFLRAGFVRGRDGHRRPCEVYARTQGHGAVASRRAFTYLLMKAGLHQHVHAARCVNAAWRGAQDKILQSMGRGHGIMVTNDGATILKSIYVDNAAAKVLVGG